MTGRRDTFLRDHLWIPALLFLPFAAVAATTYLDLAVARHFFDPATGHWWGKGSFWDDELLHRDGRYLMRLIGVVALVAFAASFRVARLAPWRRALGYFAACMALVPLLVGALKEATNVDCPWDLAGLGGERPYVHLFGDRPDGLPRAACFPGAHSSSAFALLALYFVGLGLGRPGLARAGLALGLGLGALFAFGQQARGAHFLSHDLWSAFIAWTVCLALYRWAFGGRLAAATGAISP